MSKNALKKVDENSNVIAVPEFMQGDAGMGLDRVELSDLSPPRIALMQPLSKPVEEGLAKAGHFYHKSRNEDLGSSIVVVPIFVDMAWTLWDPTPGNGVVLARGRKNDKGVWIWDPSHTKFEVTVGRDKVVWDTKGSVAESKLAKWDDKNPPPAKQSYEVLFALPEHGPDVFGIFSFSKSAYPVGRAFVQQLHAKSSLPTFAYKFRLESTSTTSKAGQKFLMPKIVPDGMVEDAGAYNTFKQMYLRVKDAGLSGYSSEGDEDHGDAGVGSAIDSSEF